MRIAYVITRGDDLGGAQIHVRDIASALQGRGDQVAVFAGVRGILTDQLGRLGVPYMEIPELARAIEPWRDARALGRLRSGLRDFNPDLVSTHCAKAGVLGRLAARSIGTPVLFTAHGWCFSDGVPARRRFLYRWLERISAPFSDRIIVVCDADRQTALRERVAPSRKIRVVHNGMPDIGPGDRADAGADPVRLVTIARLCEQKDFATLLRALARLRDLDWRLDQVGDGPLKYDIQGLARDLGLADRIAFLGRSAAVAPILARAQVYLLISNWEGFPRSILEAMRAALPVIASDVGGVREAVLEGDNGFLVPRSDDRVLADRLRRLIGSPDLRVRMGDAGRALFERQFTFERMLERTCGVYQEVSAPPAARSFLAFPPFSRRRAGGEGTSVETRP
jgi:glycosyltransferase involved in cell wall biosynthesis